MPTTGTPTAAAICIVAVSGVIINFAPARNATNSDNFNFSSMQLGLFTLDTTFSMFALSSWLPVMKTSVFLYFSHNTLQTFSMVSNDSLFLAVYAEILTMQ